MAAENRSPAGTTSGGSSRFNEAAAHGRGKRCAPRASPPPCRAGFNEAAAHGRGKRWASVTPATLDAQLQ